MGNKLKIDDRKTLTMYSINKNSKIMRFLHIQSPNEISLSLLHYIPLDFLHVAPGTFGNNLLVPYTFGNSLAVKAAHLEQIAIFTFFPPRQNREKSRFLHTPFLTQISYSSHQYIPLDFLYVHPRTLGKCLVQKK